MVSKADFGGIILILLPSLPVQSAWGFSVDDYPSEVPTGFGNGSICIQLSNSTSLHGPGLVVAGDCSWKLPFVCKSEFLLRDAFSVLASYVSFWPI